jgi:uncharacterized membrane protein
MSEIDDKINELEKRLDDLLKTQIAFQEQTSQIRYEIGVLRAVQQKHSRTVQDQPYRQPDHEPMPPTPAPMRETPAKPAVTVAPPPRRDSTTETKAPSFGHYTEPQQDAPPRHSGYTSMESHARQEPKPPSAFSRWASESAESARANLEEFIGENLISKIGIIVLLLGIGIGVKYSIDNNLISPLTRIIFGYIFGFGLVGLAIRFKGKYYNFSAVLLSGGFAALYFVTYFAYSLYSLINQPMAFILMVAFTVATVAAALVYNRQVIAHIGLVGAYAVPFLLSNNSGAYTFLFAYMSIVNAGILAISITRTWKPILYTSSLFTWLIFLLWFGNEYSPTEHFYLALTFLAIFFATFYISGIAHFKGRADDDRSADLVFTMITSIVFYGFALAISDQNFESREITILFSYLAIFSTAILITSYKYFGRFLVMVSYPLTWLIYGSWFSQNYSPETNFNLAIVFAVVFFLIYYTTTLIYRAVTDEIGAAEYAGLMLSNSFIFYGFGFAILEGREDLRHYKGLYTAAHAVFHSFVALIFGRIKTNANDVIQVLTVLIITFLTLAVPVQFDGNRITMIWAVEGALLFWLARLKQVKIFEYYAYPVMLLATGSLFVDWGRAFVDRTSYPSDFNLQVFANGNFVTALVFLASCAFVFWVNRNKNLPPTISDRLVKPLSYLLAVIGLFVLYNTFRIEIGHYFHLQAVAARAAFAGKKLDDIFELDAIWQMIYSMLFFAALNLVNLRWVRSTALGGAATVLSVLSLFVFLVFGSAIFALLRLSYMTGEPSESINIDIRYIAYLAAAVLFYALYRGFRDEDILKGIARKAGQFIFEALFYPSVLILASGELINLMEQGRIPDSTKLGLSVLWTVFALALIALGIRKGKKHLRIGGMVLIGVTLAKLFLYDIADLPTIPKTILFISVGMLLLVVSFLYTKYKDFIFGQPVEEEEL